MPTNFGKKNNFPYLETTHSDYILYTHSLSLTHTNGHTYIHTTQCLICSTHLIFYDNHSQVQLTTTRDKIKTSSPHPHTSTSHTSLTLTLALEAHPYIPLISLPHTHNNTHGYREVTPPLAPYPIVPTCGHHHRTHH